MKPSIKEVPTPILSQIEGIETEATKQTSTSDPTLALSSPTLPSPVPVANPAS